MTLAPNLPQLLNGNKFLIKMRINMKIKTLKLLGEINDFILI